jgi:hypothetical protein
MGFGGNGSSAYLPSSGNTFRLSSLYESQTWTMRKTDCERLQAFHTTSQRRILGIKGHDHITNIAIKARTGLMDLSLVVVDHRYALFGHIYHLSSDTPAHQAISLCVDVSVAARPALDWKRPPGSPRRTWHQQLEEDRGRKVDVIHAAALDRLCWKLLRPSASHARKSVTHQQFASTANNITSTMICVLLRTIE